MIDDHQEELAALHALDLLEGSEQTQFEAALARDPALRQRVAQLRAAAAALAHLAPPAEPPAGLREQILASAAAQPRTAPPAAAAPEAPQAAHISIFPVVIPWAAAACLALTAAWMTQLYFTGRTENELLVEQRRIAELGAQEAQNRIEAERIVRGRELEESRQQVAAADRRAADAAKQVAALTEKLNTEVDLARMKIATLASMLGNSPQALAVAVWDPEHQRGVLSVAKLPALAADKDYQLWIIDPEYTNPVNGGIFQVDPATGEGRYEFKGNRPVEQAAKFAVSLERKGGVPKAEGPIVLLSQ